MEEKYYGGKAYGQDGSYSMGGKKRYCQSIKRHELIDENAVEAGARMLIYSRQS
jgi:hypothetical protein